VYKILLILLLVPFTAYSQTSDSIVIAGRVGNFCNITILPTGNEYIDDLTEGAAGLHIANLVEDCNFDNGYKIYVSASNATEVDPDSHRGLLKDDETNGTLYFDILYDGAPISSQTIKDAPDGTPIFGESYSIAISFPSRTNLPPSSNDAYTYTETLTFTINAN
jgi:hypothetical protein